ncbi:MAG: hypothetical protein PHR92_07575 [Lachnospiraceae bacterium]|nr:hypothetical protein [Lachnospiraceae bacterium]
MQDGEAFLAPAGMGTAGQEGFVSGLQEPVLETGQRLPGGFPAEDMPGQAEPDAEHLAVSRCMLRL